MKGLLDGEMQAYHGSETRSLGGDRNQRNLDSPALFYIFCVKPLVFPCDLQGKLLGLRLLQEKLFIALG